MISTLIFLTFTNNSINNLIKFNIFVVLKLFLIGTKVIGRDKIFEMIDLSVPVTSGEQHYYQTYDMFTSLIQKYKSKIENAR